MGSAFSGRWHDHDKRQTVDESLVLNVSAFQDAIEQVAESGRALYVFLKGLHWPSERGFLAATMLPRAESPEVRICRVTAPRGRKPVMQCFELSITYTTPQYGGRRWWWLCPGLKASSPCKRRVQKLYLPPSFPGEADSVFACRHCHNLTYTSCQESHCLERSLASALDKFSRTYPDVDVSLLRRPLKIRRGSLRPEVRDAIRRVIRTGP